MRGGIVYFNTVENIFGGRINFYGARRARFRCVVCDQFIGGRLFPIAFRGLRGKIGDDDFQIGIFGRGHRFRRRAFRRRLGGTVRRSGIRRRIRRSFPGTVAAFGNFAEIKLSAISSGFARSPVAVCRRNVLMGKRHVDSRAQRVTIAQIHADGDHIRSRRVVIRHLRLNVRSKTVASRQPGVIVSLYIRRRSSDGDLIGDSVFPRKFSGICHYHTEIQIRAHRSELDAARIRTRHRVFIRGIPFRFGHEAFIASARHGFDYLFVRSRLRGNA